MNALLQTPMHPWHVEHGAQMVPFASWHMPVRYSSIVEEHQATRQSVGVFDISHMGRLRLDGPDALRLVDHLVTRRVQTMKPGQVRYALLTNPQGGILDDVLVYRMTDAAGNDYVLLVVNAANRPRVLDWIEQHYQGYEVTLSDLTQQWAMIAVQGPRALEAVQPLVQQPLQELRYYRATETTVLGRGGIVSRTGYTGEDGVELIVGAGAALELWEEIIRRVTPLGGKPAGLGARDTLRLEAGMPLYGHELTENTLPQQAGLDFAVDLDKDFIGAESLRQADVSALARLVGLELHSRRVAREGYAILRQNDIVGQVTSGTFSPTLQKSIAMGYVAPELAAPGTQLHVDVRGRPEPATVVPLPFYHRRKKKGSQP